MKVKGILNQILRLNYMNLGKELIFFTRFFVLVVFFLFFYLLKIISNLPLISKICKSTKPSVVRGRNSILAIFNSRAEGEISSLDLITLAVRHLTAKKVRTIITIGGMSIGFGSVIFLLSLGYGTQKLVVSRVARLEEMKQINVTVGQASSLVLNDKTLDDFRQIENVSAVIPMVSIVSKVNYNNSISDAIGYGVTKQFLEESAIKPSRGHLFEDGDISALPATKTSGQVAGAHTERTTGAKMGKQLSQIHYSILPLQWKAVYGQPSEKSEIIGYTNRITGQQDADEVWGEVYNGLNNSPEGIDTFGNIYAPWIRDTFPIWKKEPCLKTQYDCVDGTYRVLKNGANQQLLAGFITETQTTIDRYKIIQESALVQAEGQVIEKINFSIPKGKWVAVYGDGSKNDQLLNLYTGSSTLKNDLYQGELIYGEEYGDNEGWGKAGINKNGKSLGYWIKAKVPLWRQVDCPDCDNLFLTEQDSEGKQVVASAFIRADYAEIENLLEPPQIGSVLGIATESATVTASSSSSTTASPSATLGDDENTQITLSDGLVLQPRRLDDGSIDWVTIASDSATAGEIKKNVVPFSGNSKRQVVVNTALLKVFGIPEPEALDKKFMTTLILDENFFDEEGYRAESEPTELTIVGVIPDEKTPSFYLPFSDMKNLGIKNYSQVKIVVKEQDNLKAVRQNVEAMGFKTASVVDTVGKINSLFNTVRILLSLLGFVALSVAALGMFNTLTVSLMEKTREVGLMKAIGMKSNEVKRLFLAESIVMGLSGGIFGLVLSIIVGNLLSVALSLISITKGLGYLSLVYIPVPLGIGIVALSFVIGVLTGLYPSHRATKISALNALRYE